MSGTYQNFTPPHALILAGIAAITTTTILARRRLTAQSGLRLDRSLAVLAAVTWVVFTIWWALPPRGDVIHSIPLHLCDMAGLVSPVALWTGRRWARTLLHYWGLGLSTQALVTPTLAGHPFDLGFWLFWAMHAVIVGPALYDVVARGYRPHWWPDAAVASLATIGYLCLALAVDLSFGLNYGYVGQSKPDEPTLLDALGPWPQRLWLIIAGVATVYFLMTLPWSIARHVIQRRHRDRRGRATV